MERIRGRQIVVIRTTYLPGRAKVLVRGTDTRHILLFRVSTTPNEFRLSLKLPWLRRGINKIKTLIKSAFVISKLANHNIIDLHTLYHPMKCKAR